MAMSRELLTAYISLELLSFSLYVMRGLRAGQPPKSNEGSLKYIIIGALSSAILLYGLSMVYSTLGVTRFDAIAEALGQAGNVSPALWAGLALIVAGPGVQAGGGAFPHVGAGRLRRRAPAGNGLPRHCVQGGGLCPGAEAAGGGICAGPANRWDQWQIIIVVLAALSMLVGNLVALAQRNLKRLMAYSSVGHVGYIPGWNGGAGSGLATGGQRRYFLPGGLFGSPAWLCLLLLSPSSMPPGRKKYQTWRGWPTGSPSWPWLLPSASFP